MRFSSSKNSMTLKTWHRVVQGHWNVHCLTENTWRRLQASWRTETTCWWSYRFHLGRQRQHSAVICSGALLLLCPSLVMLCSHKSGRCAVELYYASHLWYPPLYTSPMASSALQHWIASPTKEGCHWQAGGENHQTWQLANPAWYT